MKIDIKLSSQLYAQILLDLGRPHPFAAERIGFAMGRLGILANDDKLVLLTRYHSIPDERYLKDFSVGARIGPDAMTAAMQAVYHGRPSREGIFHLHLHHHSGATAMSGVDRREIPQLIPGFQSVGRDAAHGIIIFSLDHGSGWVWLPQSSEPVQASTINVVGVPIRVFQQPSKSAVRETLVEEPTEIPARSTMQAMYERVRSFCRTAWAIITRRH